MEIGHTGVRGVVAVLFWAIGCWVASTACGALELAADEFRLDNGMRFVVVQRAGATMVAAGWVVGVGSADEQPGKTGTSHLLEHLMFKGTEVIGTSDRALELEIVDELDAVQRKLARRQAAGDGRVEKLENRARELEAAARDATWPGQFSMLYSEQGAVGLNANALRDATIFYVTLPTDRLELWFWLESDRLLRPVFREFHKEKRVIREERRLRVESTPTGLLVEKTEAEFWGSDPYGRPTMGLPGDLGPLSREELRSFFADHYRAPSLTAVLVGDLDGSRVKELAQTYFGRLAAESEEPAKAPAADRESSPAVSFSGLCDCPTQIRVRYRTVAFDHPDRPALDLLAGLLNGRSGRLFSDLVTGREIAFSASATHVSLKRAGYFEFHGETLGDAPVAALAEAWQEQVDRLRREPLSTAELQRAKNRLVAGSYREIREPATLLRRLLVYQGLGDWHQVEAWPDRLELVSPEDIRRVATAYLDRNGEFTAVFENRESRETSR